MCKHIHKIHSFRVKNCQAPRYVSPISDDSQILENSQIYSVGHDFMDIPDTDLVNENSGGNIGTLQFTRALDAYDKISEYLHHKKGKSLEIGNICGMLEQVVLLCEQGVREDNVNVTQFDNVKNIPSRTLLQRQWFKGIKKFSRVSKKKGKSKKPSKIPS